MLSIGSYSYLTAQTNIRSQLNNKPVEDSDTPLLKPTVNVDRVSVTPQVRDIAPIDAPNTDLDIFLKVFGNFDANSDRRITKQEFLEKMTKDGEPQEKIDRLLAQFFSPTADLDGDGLSFNEMMRQIKINHGDAFAIGDLNNDSQITQEELQSMFKIYQENGVQLDEKFINRVFNAADADKDQVLTKAEYDHFDLPGKLDELAKTAEQADEKPEITVEYILKRLGGKTGNYGAFDLNDDTNISARELEKVIDLISKHVEGFNGDRLRKIFSAKDANGDNILTAAEFRGDVPKEDEPTLTLQGVFKRLGLEPGDRFGLFDLNKDSEITAREFNKALDAYTKYIPGFNASAASRLFAAADENSDGTLTKAEYAAFKGRTPHRPDATSDVVDVSRAEQAVPAEDANKPLNLDIASVKSQLAPSGVIIDTQLLLLLQDNA